MLSSDKQKELTIKRGLKKDIFTNIALLVIAFVIYLYWGVNWAFWMVLIIAIGNLAVILVLKRLLNKVNRENGKKRV